jgi:hypothetical protein
VSPRAGLDAGARRKILCPCRGSNSDRLSLSQTLYYLIYRGSYIFLKAIYNFHVRYKGVKSENGHFEISQRNYSLRPVSCNGPEGLGQ